MTIQAVILCGGLGTRLKPITNKIPKPLAPLNGKPFIDYLLKQLKSQRIKNVLLLTGYLGDLIKKKVGDGRKYGLKITYSDGPVNWDTGRRLWESKKFLDKEFLLLYSDNFTSFNLNNLKSFHRKKKSSITLTISKKTPGNISVSKNQIVKNFVIKRSKKNNFVEIGYMIINKKTLFEEFKNKNCNLSELLRSLSKKKQVSAFEAIDDYYSISDKKRLKLTEKYLSKKKIILIDRDGVINYKAKKARYINFWLEFEFIPRTYKSLKKLSKNGFRFIVISNQAGIGRGETKLKELNKIHRNMIKKFKTDGIDIMKVYFCPHNWNEGCFCRKPKPGMLFQASKDFNFRLDNTLFIGDDPRDLIAAKKANCKGILWRNNNKYPEIDDLVKKSLKCG
ncbi:HAD-IIIA family hydrolase [Candidatus Pelagibacter sp.]|uniref:HAD-IIIA family hydrolase n=1 Tax=Candidatus Pelagibacter sp. TaxID=2024849 RepID=UPI003F8659BE